MKRIFSIVAALCFLSAQSLDAQRLTILHTNDTHSHIDPQRGGRDDGKLGVIERAAFIDSVRTADGRRNVLLLDAGDFGLVLFFSARGPGRGGLAERYGL